MSKPSLHLHDVAPLGEQPRRDRVAERVEAGLLDAVPLARGRKHSISQIIGVQYRANH